VLTRSLLLAGLRDLVRRPVQTSLLVLGVALGVAVVVAVDLANESARRAFTAATEAVGGRATHELIGGPAGVPLDYYRALRLRHLATAAAPVVEATGVALELGHQAVRLMGTDAIVDGPFRDQLATASGSGLALGLLLTHPGGCLLGARAAHRHGVLPGGSLHVIVDGRVLALTVVGLLEGLSVDQESALDGVLFLDVGVLQGLIGRNDTITRIDLIATAQEAERLRQDLPPGLSLVPAGQRAESLRQLAAAFQLNLSALSLLALVVGAFLVYNTVAFGVLQRRQVFGVLRTLGATGPQILQLVLVETATAGAAGTLLGHVFGYALAQDVVHLVTRTINDLYYVLAVTGASLNAATVARSVVLGLGTAVVAASVPAWDAARAEPVLALRPSTLEGAARRWLARTAWAGVALAAAGGMVLLLPGSSLNADFAALFALVLGSALTVPSLTLGAMAVLGPILHAIFGLLGAMAARTLARSVARTGLAVAALMTAVSVAVGVGLMIGSFRQTVRDWLELTLLADLFVDSPAAGGPGAASLPRDAVRRIKSVSGISSVETYRRVRVMSSSGEVSLGVSDTRRRRSLAVYRFRDGVGHPWQHVESGSVVVSEPFATRRHLPRHGGQVTLETDHGWVTFPVAGVFYDYASEEGTVLMSRTVYDRYWNDPDVSSVAVYVADGEDVQAVADGLRSALEGTALRVTANGSLKREALRIFDRTFAVTEALRVLALIVAFVGVWSALLSLQAERTRELATLRALGITPGQLIGLSVLESGLMGLEAGLLAIPLGCLLALVLVDVINVRSFGWTLHLAFGLRPVAEGLAASVGASLLAAVYPSLRLLRAPIAASLRIE
jgi:putative ABC transport system permease protein